MSWLLQNIVGMIGIAVGGFIAYHVYFLSKRLGLKDKLSHKDSIRKRVEPILSDIRKGISSKAELINVKKYFSHYPKTNEKDRHGHAYLGAELKSLRYDGVDFFCSIKEVYKNPQGQLSFNKSEGWKREDFNVFVAGVIPYEWIEYVDARGDEFSYRPQFFTQFKGEGKSPYKYFTYYRESDTYHKGSDPMEMRWSSIDVA